MTTLGALRLHAGKDTTKAADAGRNDSPNEEAENQSVGVERRRRFIVYVVWYGGMVWYHLLSYHIKAIVVDRSVCMLHVMHAQKKMMLELEI